MENLNILGHHGNREAGIASSFQGVYDCFINENVDGTDLKTRLTSDKKIIVYHDKKINGKNIYSQTQGEIASYGLRNAKYICDLKNYLKFCGEKKVLIDIGTPIEIGYFNYNYYLDYIIDLLKDYNLNNVAVESSRFKSLDKIKEKIPELDTVLLVDIESDLKDYLDYIDGINYHYSFVNSTNIYNALKNHIDLYTHDNDDSSPHLKKMQTFVKIYHDLFKGEDLTMNVINFLPEKTKMILKK